MPDHVGIVIPGHHHDLLPMHLVRRFLARSPAGVPPAAKATDLPGNGSQPFMAIYDAWNSSRE
jgi:hypothetical protein